MDRTSGPEILRNIRNGKYFILGGVFLFLILIIFYSVDTVHGVRTDSVDTVYGVRTGSWARVMYSRDNTC